jgi:hypothetical protein
MYKFKKEGGGGFKRPKKVNELLGMKKILASQS